MTHCNQPTVEFTCEGYDNHRFCTKCLEILPNTVPKPPEKRVCKRCKIPFKVDLITDTHICPECGKAKRYFPYGLPVTMKNWYHRNRSFMRSIEKYTINISSYDKRALSGLYYDLLHMYRDSNLRNHSYIIIKFCIYLEMTQKLKSTKPHRMTPKTRKKYDKEMAPFFETITIFRRRTDIKYISN